MKAFLVVLALAAVALAEDDIDWSTVKRRDIRIPLPFDLDKLIFDDRIVGGNEAIPHSIPYQAGLLVTTLQGTFFCGGTLISTNYVLTAAHCVEGAMQIQVRLGAHVINDNEPTQQRLYTSEYKIHEAWNVDTLMNDIAVVILTVPAVLNEHVHVVPLPYYTDVGHSFSGEPARISGWGLDSDAATGLSPVLREVIALVMTNLSCNTSFMGDWIQASHICTVGTNGVGACNGDSGGPLISNNRQIGIVSFGPEVGCEVGWPTVYARVTSYLDWIGANTDVTIYA